jgi:hypothetical protein
MAAISMKTMAAALLANAAGVGSATSLSTANATALANICALLAKPSNFQHLHKMLNDTDKKEISSAI